MREHHIRHLDRFQLSMIGNRRVIYFSPVFGKWNLPVYLHASGGEKKDFTPRARAFQEMTRDVANSNQPVSLERVELFGELRMWLIHDAAQITRMHVPQPAWIFKAGSEHRAKTRELRFKNQVEIMNVVSIPKHSLE
jgi:hypothetical protein